MKKAKGFTLIELIIVIAVLLFVVGTAIGIFISIVQHQRIILAEQELLNQVSYVLEHMSKALRMAGKDSPVSPVKCLKDDLPGTNEYPGNNYLLTHPFYSFYTGIKFINQSDNNICQEFYLDNGVLKEKKSGLPAEGIALTSDKFYINSIKFGINGKNGSIVDSPVDGGNNFIQPRITIYLDIQIKEDDSQSSKKIQTTISQRDLNVSQ
ncbi:MAG: hypothetical protein LiPW30_745 [Parcubacteria group bacterium LiPW_30]|nr:MAG: hypothetical protein LiPW30_745 [Parcubacteria group bacterium LiPW_30]